MAYLLVFLLGKQSPLFGNGSCGNQADSHALSVKQLEIHQLFYSMSDGVAKIEKGTLALFLIPAALLGLVLRKPLEKFMEWYVEKVESSKLIS